MDIRSRHRWNKIRPQIKDHFGDRFLCAGGLILTCAHVIADYYQPGRQIDCQLEGQTSYFKADVIYFSPKVEYDLAILQPAEEVEYTPLPISTSQYSKGNSFSIFGYPNIEFRRLEWRRDDHGLDTTQQGEKFPCCNSSRMKSHTVSAVRQFLMKS